MTFQDTILAAVREHPGINVRDLCHALGDRRPMDVCGCLWRLDAALLIYERGHRVWPTTKAMGLS